jgi:hypothetical protein
VILAAFILAFAAGAFGQEATIVGTVTDPTGAAVPNANITVTNLDTGVVSTVQTNNVGQYVTPSVRIGGYTVRAEAAGFKVAERKGINLNVGDRARVDFTLELGSATETINVEAAAVQVQTESGEISDVVTGDQVVNLATNGRSMYSLALLTPGASGNMPDFQQPTPIGGNASVAFNGMRQNHNLWTIDGGEASDRGGAGGASVMPSMDAIAEFRVLASNYAADYGLSSAATMVMVVKGGKKDFHGTAWEFFRNDALDANNYFFNQAGQDKPKLRFNTYGFNIGGPVLLPGGFNKDRDKTFFFYNMEWRKLIQGGVLNRVVPLTSTYGGVFDSQIKIPTAGQLSDEQAARFSAAGLTLSPSADNPLYFPNNTIPTSLLDPNAQALLSAGIFPAPNSGDRFIGGSDAPINVREEIVRIDQRFNDKFWMFGHFISEQISQTYVTSLWSGSNVPTVGTVLDNPSYHGVIRATYSISPTLLNETAFNANGNQLKLTPEGLISRPSGVNIPELFPSNNLDRIPGINLSGSTGANFDISSWPWYNKADDYQIRDDVSWMKGSHQIKMGASWALYKKKQDLFGNTQGGFSFNGQYTGNDVADFLLGYANSYSELAVQDFGRWDNVSYALYVQDNWRVNSRLTLNLGLRWDGIPHTYEENNRGSNFYPALYDTSQFPTFVLDANGNPTNAISPNSAGLGKSPNPDLADFTFYLNGIGIPGQNGIPKGMVDNYWNTFGPRIGFAFDPMADGKTVIRGGFGVMYERIQGNDMYNGGPNIPFSASVSNNNVSLSNPQTDLRTGATIVAPITIPSITGLDIHYKIPTSFQYSLGVQRELTPGTVLSVNYVGNQNRYQTYYQNINNPDPSLLPGLIDGTLNRNHVVPYLGFGSIRLVEAGMNSHYNSLQMNVRGQVTRDFYVQAAYTLAKAVDPGTSFGGDLNDLSNPYDRSYDENGYVSFADRTHVASINFLYDIPLFREAESRAARTLLGGWELSGIVTLQTGLPLNVTLGGPQGSNGLTNGTNRPNFSGSVSYPSTEQMWFDTSGFSSPAPGVWGNMERGVVRGPGRHNWNVSLFKNFAFTEQVNLEFRLESFNTFNHTQFNNVSTGYSSSNFGAVTSTWDPRTFQLGMKLGF